MRALFTFAGGVGHFHPMVALIRATLTAGHEVAVAAGPARQAAIAAAGFTPLPVGSPPGVLRPVARQPLVAPDREREDRDLRELFVRKAGGMRVPQYLELFGQWQPDLVVCEEADFGSVLAAEKAGLPYANFQVIASGSFIRPAVIGDAVAELRAANGLPPDPMLVMSHRRLLLSPFPPSFRDPEFPLPPTAFSFRPPTGVSVGSAVPLIYFTLGTEFNVESGDLFERVLAGLRELPATVVATVGEGIDPAEFGPQPEHVRVVRYLPQAEVLPLADLVVSHGGSGSVIGALAHGLPGVLLPLGADQPHNADQCVRLGVGRVLDPVSVTPEQVRTAAGEVLADPGYRQAAERVRTEILSLPEPAAAVPLLEQLVRTGSVVPG